MIVIRLNAKAIKRRMIGMIAVPAIIGAYWIAVTSGSASVKSLPIFASVSILGIGILILFECFSLFKINNPIVFILNADGSGFYRPSFKEFSFHVNPPFTTDILSEGVCVSPKIEGLPYFAERNGMTFIRTNRSYDVRKLGMAEEI